MAIRGARYLHVLVPCPLGWGGAAGDTIKLARLGHASGLFPVFEAEHGEVTARAADPRAGCRSAIPAPAGALRAPVRARADGTDVIARIQAIADRNIARYGLLPRRRRSP